MNRIRSRTAHGAIAAFIMAMTAWLIVSPAAAQPVSINGFTAERAFELFGSDYGDAYTSLFLNQLFGPLFPAADGTSVNPVFAHLIGYFNIFILVIGVGLLFWNVIVGMMQTAHEGTVLGQRWSSLWAPIRIVFAIGLVIPIPNLGGYNVAQAGVAYLVKGSTMMASTMWAESARIVIGMTSPISASPSTIPAQTFSGLYKMAACTAIVNEQMRLAAPSGSAPLHIGLVEEQVDDGRVQMYTAVLGGDASVQQKGICGSYTTPPLPAYIQNIMDAGGNDVAGARKDNFTTLPTDSATRDQIRSIFIEAHRDALQSIYNDMITITSNSYPVIKDAGVAFPDIAGAIVNSKNSAQTRLNAEVERIMNLALGVDRTGQLQREALLARIEGSAGACTSASGSISSGSEATEKCLGEGWIGAGSWYMMMAQMNNEIASLTAVEYHIKDGSYVVDAETANRSLYVASGGKTGWFGSVGDRAQDAGMATTEQAALEMARYMEMFDQSTMGLAAAGFPMSNERLAGLNQNETPGGLLEYLGDYRSTLTEAAMDMIKWTSPTQYGSADPIIGVTKIGHWLNMFAGMLMLTAAAAGFVTGGAIGAIFAPIIGVMVAAGSTLAFILPMMPSLLWVMAVSGYFILILEAIVAVNLWALAHMRMDGDGVSGEAGRQGWLMLLSLLMTPPLMILGFLAGMTLFRVTAAILGAGMSQALSGILGGGIWTLLFSVLAFSVMIAVMYMAIIERSFTLVTEFPGRVLRWMGANAELDNGDSNRVRASVGGGMAAVYRGSSNTGRSLHESGGKGRRWFDNRQNTGGGNGMSPK